MNRHMKALAGEATDALVLLVDPDQVLGLRALVDTARRGNGAAQIREHDLQVLIERIRRKDGNGPAYTNGVGDADPAWRAYARLEEMG